MPTNKIRRGTVSVFDGPAPEIETFDDPEQEAEAVGNWIAGRLREGVQPHEIGVFVRSMRELRRARAAVKRAGTAAAEVSDERSGIRSVTAAYQLVCAWCSRLVSDP